MMLHRAACSQLPYRLNKERNTANAIGDLSVKSDRISDCLKPHRRYRRLWATVMLRWDSNGDTRQYGGVLPVGKCDTESVSGALLPTLSSRTGAS